MKYSQTKGTVKIRLFIYLSSTDAHLKQVTESMLVLKIQKLCFIFFLIVHFSASGPCAGWQEAKTVIKNILMQQVFEQISKLMSELAFPITAAAPTRKWSVFPKASGKKPGQIKIIRVAHCAPFSFVFIPCYYNFS